MYVKAFKPEKKHASHSHSLGSLTRHRPREGLQEVGLDDAVDPLRHIGRQWRRSAASATIVSGDLPRHVVTYGGEERRQVVERRDRGHGELRLSLRQL